MHTGSIEELKKEEIGLVKEIEDFNNYIKMIEPNLNKILFSKKVILVEGPNDLLVYKYLIEQKAKEFLNDENFSKAYLNFHNIAIIPHHGKATAWFLIELCKHIRLDYLFCRLRNFAFWQIDKHDIQYSFAIFGKDLFNTESLFLFLENLKNKGRINSYNPIMHGQIVVGLKI